MRGFRYLPVFALLAGTLSLPFSAHADGLTATGTTLPIGAAGTTVITVTGGSTPSAAFTGPVSVNGTLSSTGILSAPAGVNVNNNGILYPDGSAFFSSNATVGGMLGIGTTAPTNALDVVSQPITNVTTPVGAFHAYTGYAGNQTADGQPNYGGNIWIGGNSDMRFDGGTDSDFWFNNNGAVAGATGFRWEGDATHASQFNLYIQNSGNVGIGTQTPNARLHVAGDIRIPYANALILGDADGLVDGGGGERIHNISPDGTQGYGIGFEAGWLDRLVVSAGGGIGIGTATPKGNLDIENPTGNATLCLNGNCVSSMAQLDGKNGAAGAQGPQGPAGPQGPQGQPGSTAVLNISCGANQVLTGISNGSPVCQDTVQLQTFLRISTTIADVNNNCGYPADPNPPGYNQLQYNTTCASRYCSNKYGYGWGMLTEDGAGYNQNQPWNSSPSTYVSIACAK